MFSASERCKWQCRAGLSCQPPHVAVTAACLRSHCTIDPLYWSKLDGKRQPSRARGCRTALASPGTHVVSWRTCCASWRTCCASWRTCCASWRKCCSFWRTCCASWRTCCTYWRTRDAFGAAEPQTRIACRGCHSCSARSWWCGREGAQVRRQGILGMRVHSPALSVLRRGVMVAAQNGAALARCAARRCTRTAELGTHATRLRQAHSV